MTLMKHNLQNTRITRKNLIKYLNTLSIEELNLIPEGFNNNIFWNIAHVAVTQQILVYKLSGLKMYLSDDFINEFKKGAAPERYYTKEDVDFLKSIFLNLVDELENDFDKGLFKTYTEYPTSYGVVLTSAEEAIAFNNIHEGLHFGYVMALKRSL